MVGEAKRRQFLQPCAYCGTLEGKRTDDHVPPSSLLLRPYPRRITVRACVACNNEFSRELDQEFALFLSTAIGVTSQESERFWSERVLPGLQADKRRREEFLQAIQPIFRRAPAGHIEHLGRGVPVRAEMVRAMLKRITRGLFYYKYGEVLGDVPMEADLLRDVEKHVDVFGAHGSVITVGDQFGCLHGRVGDDPRGSFWIYQFYNRCFASVYTGGAAGREAAPAPLVDGELVLLQPPGG